MEAWFAANMWWLLPAIAVGYLAIRIFDTHAGESLPKRILYSVRPELEPGSRAQRRVVANVLGSFFTLLIAALVAVGIWLFLARG